jgi:hypothetical protein
MQRKQLNVALSHTLTETAARARLGRSELLYSKITGFAEPNHP